MGHVLPIDTSIPTYMNANRAIRWTTRRRNTRLYRSNSESGSCAGGGNPISSARAFSKAYSRDSRRWNSARNHPDEPQCSSRRIATLRGEGHGPVGVNLISWRAVSKRFPSNASSSQPSSVCGPSQSTNGGVKATIAATTLRNEALWVPQVRAACARVPGSKETGEAHPSSCRRRTEKIQLASICGPRAPRTKTDLEPAV